MEFEGGWIFVVDLFIFAFFVINETIFTRAYDLQKWWKGLGHRDMFEQFFLAEMYILSEQCDRSNSASMSKLY